MPELQGLSPPAPAADQTICRLHPKFCDRSVVDAQGYCLLHSQDPKKDPEAFAAALAEHRQKRRERFEFIVFPPSHSFREAVLSAHASFFLTKFLGEAVFANARFAGPVEFGGAEFLGGANFDNARFEGKVSFLGAAFSGEGRFLEAEFSGEADFTKAEFRRGAVFIKTKFHLDATFDRAQFLVDGFFYEAVFEHTGSFEAANFEEKTTFASVSFSGAADFNSATLKNAHFGDSRFEGGVSFAAVRFTRAYFYDTVFGGRIANFANCSFVGRTLFNETDEKGEGRVLFQGVDEVDFTDVVLSPPTALIIRNADLRRCLFLNTDLRKADFTNVRWITIGTRYGVYDEEVPLKEGKARHWGHLERLYRDLKQNYENRKNYELAGDFHYGEKQMRKKNPETPPGQRILLSLYWLISGYGERYDRPLICGALLLAVCAFGYLALGLEADPGKVRLALDKPGDWLRSLHYSLQVMTLLSPDDLQPVGWSKPLKTLETLLGPFFLALLALAIRQRLKR
jgi:uncharacterized protein YjbI with pentapeptide repeats